MNIEANIIAKECLWRQIHAGATYHPHKSISGSIKPQTIEYHNITYTIT